MFIKILYFWGMLNLLYIIKFRKKSWIPYCILGIQFTIIGSSVYIVYPYDSMARGFMFLGLILISYGFYKIEKRN